jgi:neurotransmitter:Na+ symporter, NSS family
MAAAAVGLGNLWRFPYLAGENGGGAFIVAYLIAIVAIGIPVMLLEVSAGRLALGSPVTTFRHVHPRAAIIGWLVVLLTVVITSYYLVITGWTLGYAIDSLRVAVRPFEEFREGYGSLWYQLVIAALVAGVLVRGIGMVEQVARFLMPPLLITIVVLVAIGLTMDGRGEAVRFLFEPDFSQLRSPGLWLFAVGQAFYSLAIGQGYLITYGSYLPGHVNLPRATLVVAGTETAVALMAGLMLFPVVFTYGLAPDEGSQLAFTTLPTAFEQMTGGAILAAVFFPLFFAAAFSSSIAGMKVVVTTARDEFRLDTVRAVAISTAIVVVLGIPSALSFTAVDLRVFGEPFLDVVDRVGATQVVVTSGVVGAAVLAWFIPRARMHEVVGRYGELSTLSVVTIGRGIPLVALLWLVYWLLS